MSNVAACQIDAKGLTAIFAQNSLDDAPETNAEPVSGESNLQTGQESFTV